MVSPLQKRRAVQGVVQALRCEHSPASTTPQTARRFCKGLTFFCVDGLQWSLLEAVDRKILQKALEKATENCTRPYFHAYGNVLIAIVSREKLMKLPSVERLFKDLKIKIGEYAARS